MSIELRHLRYFVAVAQELHFGKAAERLHIAQPALSIQIKQLEEQLGGKLFHRTNRSVSLTEAGNQFLVYAHDILQRVDQHVNATKRLFSGKFGEVYIGYSKGAAYSGILEQILQIAQDKMPNVYIHLQEHDPIAQVNLILERKLHVGFTSTLSHRVPKAVSVMPLTAWPLQIALPITHPLAKEESISMKQLTYESFVAYFESEELDSTSILKYISYFSPQTIHQTSNANTAMILVGAGLGVALMPSFFNRMNHNPAVVLKPLSDVNAMIDGALLYNRDEYEPLVKTFIETINRGITGSSKILP